MSVGYEFRAAALRPVAALHSRESDSVLLQTVEALHPATFGAAFSAAVGLVADRAGRSSDWVQGVLPVAEVDAAMALLGQAHHEVVRAWNSGEAAARHAGKIGEGAGVIGTVADIFTGGLAGAVLGVAGNLVGAAIGASTERLRQARVRGPFERLVARINCYEEVVIDCAAALASNAELHAAVADKVRRTRRAWAHPAALRLEPLRALKPADFTVEDWTRYRCLSRAKGGAKWKRCLARSAYALEAGQGCPGSTRCCPPGD